MALYYDTKHPESGRIFSNCIRIVETNKFGNEADHLNENAAECVIIQADGDELEAIKAQFHNIRMHNGRVVRWVGEDALFIALNLK